jgi:D-alanyl-D-alanine carboxypeptidase
LLMAASAAAAPPRAAPADRALKDALASLVDSEGGPPGAIAVVQRGRARVVRTAGVADLETGAPLRPSDHLRTASVSKAFVGATALSLVETGRLSLEDTIGDTVRGMPSTWSEVTLGQMLNHTSGLPDFSESRAFLDWLVAHLRDYIAPRAVIDFVRHEPLNFKPGSAYRYSNTDNLMVGLFIEAATARPYARVLRARVTRPLGLTRTTLPRDWVLPKPFIHGYDIDPPNPPEDFSELASMASLWAAGGVVSTAGDLHRFIRGYVGRKLFGRAIQRRQLQLKRGESQPPGPGENAAGMAIFRYRSRCGTLYGHTGNVFGYTQFIAASLDGRRSVTVTATTQLSRTSGSKPAFAALRKALLAGACSALAR